MGPKSQIGCVLSVCLPVSHLELVAFLLIETTLYNGKVSRRGHKGLFSPEYGCKSVYLQIKIIQSNISK